MIYKCIAVSCLASAAALFCGITSVQGARIEGNIRGTDGHPLTGAQVHFDSKDANVATAVPVSSRGNYSASGLKPGLYRISVVSGGAIKTFVSVRVTPANARIDFDLRGGRPMAKHYVWVASDTGSHLGGQWVEANANGAPVGVDALTDRASGELARDIARRAANTH
ncbi:MAG: carboxypeptidase regulatory-like domain-containing protein [Verrucomicrobia bacterium]|nr:carboxypeptidase regulatory-like domain-containing protein [Verrucomicrobiota bacterium]